MKNLLVFITLCLISISCSKAKDDLKIETNGYCSEKKAISIATEALDHITDANYQITYVGVKPDLFTPGWCIPFQNFNMRETYKDYFVKEQFRASPKQDARVRIAKAKKKLDQYPEKHIGYIMDISGILNDDDLSKKFSLSISLDIDMIEYIYTIYSDNWNYYRVYNTVSKDSISNYLNRGQVESAVMKKYQDAKDILIYFYD